MPEANMKKVVTIALMLLFGLTSCSLIQESEAPDPGPVMAAADNMVSVTGIVVPEAYAVLSAAAAGQVSDVLIAEGQAVAEGSALVVLGDTTQESGSMAAAELERKNAQQALDDLNERAALDRAEAWLALLDAKAVLNEAEAAWDEIDQDETQDDIDNAREEVIEAKEDLEDAQDTYDRFKDLDEANAERTRAENDLEEAQKTYNEKVRLRDELINDLDLLEARVDAALEALELARADYEALLSGPDLDQLALVEARLASAEAQIEAAQAQIDDKTLKAPFAGTVTKVNIRPAEWVSPGTPVLTLADLDTLRVETTDLNEIDVVNIQVGDTAGITFDAIPEQEFTGTVTEIALQASSGTGVNYTVVVVLDEMPPEARWGMTVFVDIELDQ